MGKATWDGDTRLGRCCSPANQRRGLTVYALQQIRHMTQPTYRQGSVREHRRDHADEAKMRNKLVLTSCICFCTQNKLLEQLVVCCILASGRVGEVFGSVEGQSHELYLTWARVSSHGLPRISWGWERGRVTDNSSNPSSTLSGSTASAVVPSETGICRYSSSSAPISA
jgi:hypothetical protein